MENRDPFVSIVIPVYNGQKYLELSIESCINQTYKNWEMIIIDDASSDKSEEIVRKYIEKDSRIKYYRNSKNLKLPKSLNRGFALARGDYLTWTSDDNFYYPEAIEKMVGILKKKESEFVFAAYSTIDEYGRKISVNRAPKDYYHAIWSYNFVGACFLYTRNVYEIIGNYDPNMFLCEDYDYWLRIFGHFNVQYIDEELYGYRQHKKTLSQTHKFEQFERLEKVLLKNSLGNNKLKMIDKFYLYRGLNRSRLLKKKISQKYYYLPRLFCYKIWHRFFAIIYLKYLSNDF